MHSEATCAGQCFGHLRGGHAAEEGLEGESDDARSGVAVKDFLASFYLLPIHPVGDGVDLLPELLERLVFTSTLSEELVYIPGWFGVRGCLWPQGKQGQAIKAIEAPRGELIIGKHHRPQLLGGKMMLSPFELIVPDIHPFAPFRGARQHSDDVYCWPVRGVVRGE
ncbi:hypothetical protein VTK26DRAFT_369 [Humicola hyalothermophila]